ncbi:MAG: DUF1566 domain-containing protein [bacterium]|jgi:hypothetical protein|nr:DUF1566 domain-containing protein [bacterium]
MRKGLISLMFVLLFVMGSCGGDTGGKFKPSDCTGEFPNYHKGLCWSEASSSSMDWDNAITYCENLGGRLPAISELRTLIQNCPTTETGGECGVTDSCLSSDCWSYSCRGCKNDTSGEYSVFRDTDLFWSSSELSDRKYIACYVSFKAGHVGYVSNSIKYGVRCVK